jgi:hypothetical protein
MRLTGELVPTGAHHALALCDHATDAGIGLGGVETSPGQSQRVRHVPVIELGKRGVHGDAMFLL